MKGLWLRLFLATVGSTVLIWQLYEWVWLPYAYDLESEAIQTEMMIQSDALKQQFANLPVEKWAMAVQSFNQTSDNLLELVNDTDAKWVELYATLLANGEDGMYFDGMENVAVILLSDDRSLLRNEKFYFDQFTFLDETLWLFVILALVVPGGLLWWVIFPLGSRLNKVSNALENLFDDGPPPSPLIVHGDGALGDVESSLNGVTDQLNAAMSEWQESLSAQRDLLHAVAHEFRSPIARLRFAQDMLAESTDEIERHGLEQKMDASIAELDDLVREVLGYSRVRHGGYRLQRIEADLGSILEGVCAKVRQVYPTVEIVIHTDGENYTVSVDERLTERAIINVVRNAARYAVRRVDIDLIANARQTEVIISDDGPGIAPGKRDRIFEPFTRLDTSRSRDSGGSGLGLAIVQAIMQQHSGSVVCEESKNGGARFVLSWPRQD